MTQIYLYSQIDSGILLAEASEELKNIRIVTMDGADVQAPVISQETLEGGIGRARIDASERFCWSPDTAVLY
ncbi:MAG: hypothetical protein MJ106_08105, partial [Lentisphaeria bacterium]|nr:hypothetical protein [Lentisphaeria bacterium]